MDKNTNNNRKGIKIGINLFFNYYAISRATQAKLIKYAIYSFVFAVLH